MEDDGGGFDQQIEGTYPFTDFKLKALIEDVNLVAEYKEGPYRKKTVYKNLLQGINLTGKEALEELDEIFSSFHFNENSSESIVKDTILSSFLIPEDAKQIKLEIKYRSGEKRQYSF